MDFEYDFELFKNWGADFINETDAEVNLHLLTPVESIPFFREMGTIFHTIDGTPTAERMNDLAPLSAIIALGNYSDTARRERQVLTEYDLVTFSDVEKKNGDSDITVGYYRVADAQFAEAVV